MVRKNLILLFNLGFLVIITVEKTEAFYNSPHHRPISVDMSEVPGKSQKTNMYKPKEHTSHERQHSLSDKPKSNYHRESDLKTNEKFNLNPDVNINLHHDHHNHNIKLQSPMHHGHELEEKYKQNLHQSVNDHHQNLHHALVKNNENLHKTLIEQKKLNPKNFIQNNEQISNIPPLDVKVKYPNEENLYNNKNINKLQSDSQFTSKGAYDQTKSPYSYDAHGIPAYNNAGGQQKVSLKYEEPSKGVKSQTYASDEYYYDDHKIKQPEISPLNGQQSYNGGINPGPYNTGYPPSHEITVVDKNIPGQYDLDSYIQSHISTNKNPFNSMSHQNTGKYNSYNPSSDISGFGNANKNFQSVYGHSPTQVPFGGVNSHYQSAKPYKSTTSSAYFQNYNPSTQHEPQTFKGEYPNSNPGNENEYNSKPYGSISSHPYSQNPESVIKNTKYPQTYSPEIETGNKDEHLYSSNKNSGNGQHHHNPSLGITYDQDYRKEKGYSGYGSSEVNDGKKINNAYSHDSPDDSRKINPTSSIHGLENFEKSNKKNAYISQIKDNSGDNSPNSPSSLIDHGNKHAFVTSTKSIPSSYGQNEHNTLTFKNSKDSEGHVTPNSGVNANLGSIEMPNLHSKITSMNKYTSPMKMEGFKFNDAPIVHQIYMSDPLLKSSDFFPSELTAF